MDGSTISRRSRPAPARLGDGAAARLPTDVATACFADHRYGIRAFGRAFGETPGAYRRRMRGGDGDR